MCIYHNSILWQLHILQNRVDYISTLFGTKLYSRSRGIVSPKPRELHYNTFQEIVKDYNVDYEKNINLCVADKTINSFTYRKYKKNKKLEE